MPSKQTKYTPTLLSCTRLLLSRAQQRRNGVLAMQDMQGAITTVIEPTVKFQDVTPLDTRDQGGVVSMVFANYTSRTLCILQRNNLVLRIPSQRRTKGQPSGLYVQYRIAASVGSQLESFREQETLASHEAEDYINAARDTSVRVGGTAVLAEYFYPEEHLRTKTYAYCQKLDISITMRDAKYLRHPRLHHTDAQRAYEEARRYEQGTTTVTMSLISNTAQQIVRWVRLGEEAIELKSQPNSELLDGLYVISNSVGEGMYCDDAITPEFFPLKEADQGGKYQLYRTREEALSVREQVNREHEEKILKLDRDLAESRRQHDLAKTNWQRELDDEKHKWEERQRVWQMEQAERDRLNQIVKEQNERERERLARLREEQEHATQLRSMERKDHYEERSAARKDTSEWFKFVPAFIAAFTALVVLFKK